MAVRIAAFDGRAQRGEQLLARDADPVRPHAPGALLAEQGLAEVEDRRAEPHGASSARRTCGVGALRLVVRPAPLHAVVDHERVSPVVLDALDRRPARPRRARPPPPRSRARSRSPRRSRRPGSSPRTAGPNAAAPATRAAGPARTPTTEARAGPPSRPGSRAVPPRRSTAPRPCRRGHSGSSSMPATLPATPRVSTFTTAGCESRRSRGRQRRRATSFSSSRLARSSCSSVDLSTEAAPTSRLTRALMTRCASPVRRAIVADQHVRARPAAARASRTRSPARTRPPPRPRGGHRERRQRGRDRGGAGSAKSCSASPGCVVCSTSSSRRAHDDSARNASPASPRSPRSATCSPAGLEVQRVVALLLDLDRELLQARIRRQEDVATSAVFGAGVRRMKRPITWRKNSSVRAVVA